MDRSQIIKRCRRLRRSQTEAEKELWNLIRNRKINGLKFLRQHPFVYQNTNSGLYYYIADFYCREKKTIIELDGEIHKTQKDYDENRDLTLEELGFTVVRFKNCEIEKAVEFIRGL